MSLGFSVDELLPRARGGGQLKMGLVKLGGNEWRVRRVLRNSPRASN